MLHYTKKEFDKMLRDKLTSEYAVTLEVASDTQIYRALAMITREIMSDRQKVFQAKTLGSGHKQVYYLCMEFLMGRSLRTSLFNLGLNEVAEQVSPSPWRAADRPSPTSAGSPSTISPAPRDAQGPDGFSPVRARKKYLENPLQSGFGYGIVGK